MYERLKVTRHDEGRIVHLEFAHGKANEMGTEELRELDLLVEELRTGTAVALVTYSRKRSSKGTPIFVAGANVTERVGWNSDRVKAHVRTQREILTSLANAPVFHVCVVDGIALGWGTEYTLSADYVLAGDGATFGLPETGLGILPGAGGTSELWARIGAPQALRLGMTGERISADEALRIGLVQERTQDVDTGLARAAELARLAARRSPTAIAAYKRGVLLSVGAPVFGPHARSELEARAYEWCVDSGEAAIGRANFDAVLAGQTPPWGPRKLADR
jgi:enoyl-CoA hydratase/carnithine racemase